MKRLAAGLASMTFGILLSWLCLYTFSHIDFQDTGRSLSGSCTDIEHCPSHWWTYLQLFATLLGPAALFGLMGAVGWKRWSFRKWLAVSCIAIAGTTAFYLAGYLL